MKGPMRPCGHAALGPFVFNERRLSMFITKAKGPVERGKLKTEKVRLEIGGPLSSDLDMDLRAYREGTGSQWARQQLLTSIFSAKE